MNPWGIYFQVNSRWIDVDMNEPVRTSLVQIVIISNHQNGKDTHVRNVKLFSSISNVGLQEADMLPFTSPAFEMCAQLR